MGNETVKFITYKYWLNEKFTNDYSDPVHDMGIGIYGKRNFETYQDIAKFLIKLLPNMFGLKQMPKDIINDMHGYFIKQKYHEKLDDYLYKYIFINNKPIIKDDSNSMTGLVHQTLYKIFKQKGYKEYK